jgi:hypothetical protein
MQRPERIQVSDMSNVELTFDMHHKGLAEGRSPPPLDTKKNISEIRKIEMQEDLGEDNFLLLVVCDLGTNHSVNVDSWFHEIQIRKMPASPTRWCGFPFQSRGVFAS